MKAEDLITLLQKHLGEDIKVVTTTCTEFGDPEHYVYDILGIENSMFVLGLESITPVDAEYTDDNN